MPLSQVNQYGEDFIAQRLSTVDGVAQVQVYGSQKYAVRIQLDPQKLSGAGRSVLTKWRTRSTPATSTCLTGVLWGTEQTYTVQSNGQLENAAAFKRNWSSPGGTALRCGSRISGLVLDGVQNTKTASWFSGTRAIVLAIQRQPGTNTVAVAERVQAIMANAPARELPAARSSSPHCYDRSLAIEQSVTRRQVHSPAHASCLVVLVIFLFLRNLSRNAHPQPGAADVAGRHLRGHVPAGVTASTTCR